VFVKLILFLHLWAKWMFGLGFCFGKCDEKLFGVLEGFVKIFP
jgi:hypothetical protein